MQKIFSLFGAIFIFTLAIFSTASAAEKSPAEISNISIYDVDEDTLRIEISFKKNNISGQNISAKLIRNLLVVDLENTIPGRVNRHAGKFIKDKESISNISVNEIKIKHTRIQFTMNIPISDSSYKTEFLPPVRREKKPARFVIDIEKKRVAENDFDMNDKVVVLDAGHGGSDSGARGPHGVLEKDVTLAVALKAEKLLEDAGAKVIMTRTTDRDVASARASNTAELQARVDKIPPQADIFISIHCNAFSNPYSKGMETYYFKNSLQGRRLAQLLNEELENYGGRMNRGVKTANFYVLRHSKVPACLVELAFVTNHEEESLLADENYQDRLAIAITAAVNRYFNE